MRTSVVGMAAQSGRLSAVAENVANTSTVGYKSAQADFSTLVLSVPPGEFTSGGVNTNIRRDISRQGGLERSGSQFDLAVSGSGFFLVEDAQGGVTLTRAGSFVPNAEGKLVNSAGFRLLGLPAGEGAASPVTVNGTAGLEAIDVIKNVMEAAPTTAGRFSVNLPTSATTVAAADLPSNNLATSLSSARSSIVVYGNLGEETTLDVHYARTTTPGEWEVTVFDSAGRAASGGMPYANAPVTTATLRFDAQGQLDTSGTTSLAIAVPGGGAMTLDLTGTTQLASDFAVMTITTNGNAPSGTSSFDIGPDGLIYQILDNGTRRPMYQIPLATVASPDNLIAKSGNSFQLSAGSGDLRVGLPGAGGLGTTIAGALEASTVDLASELTDMVEAQRNYTANSKVFQTGSELMDVLVNLKR